MSFYPYLVGCFLFFPAWLFVYWKLKNDRRDILIVSLIFGIIGLSTPFLFGYDWWHPQTILGKFLSIEDFLLGFTNGSLAIMSHRLFFKQNETGEVENKKIIAPLFIIFIVTSVLFYGFHIPSFYANFCGLLASSVYVLVKRFDLLGVGVVSGAFMSAISLPIYWLLIKVSPNWVGSQWLIDNLSGVSIIGVPIEDIVWYFLIGFCLSLIYPYYKNIYYEKLFG